MEIPFQETYPGDGKADNFQYSPYKDIKKDRERPVAGKPMISHDDLL